MLCVFPKSIRTKLILTDTLADGQLEVVKKINHRHYTARSEFGKDVVLNVGSSSDQEFLL